MLRLSLAALIFDFDGLILDTEYPEYISWRDIYSRFGLTLTVEKWARNIGRGASTIAWNPYNDLDDLLGYSVDRDAIRAVRRKRFAELMAGESILPGVLALIADARRRGLLLAIASSSPHEWVDGYLARFDLLEVFDAILCGDDVTETKPSPELYCSALAALGCRPEEVIALEDSPNGVASAKAAGLFCVAVPNTLTHHTNLAAADMQVASLAELCLDDLLTTAMGREAS